VRLVGRSHQDRVEQRHDSVVVLDKQGLRGGRRRGKDERRERREQRKMVVWRPGGRTERTLQERLVSSSLLPPSSHPDPHILILSLPPLFLLKPYL
jgi:hypothetical protein